jgi:hypothetical protein
VLYLTAPYTLTSSVVVPVSASYGVWVGGSIRSRVRVDVDGRRVGSARNSLSWPGTFTYLGAVHLTPGRHALRFHYDGPGLRPGSGGIPPFGVGPIVLSAGTPDSRVTYVRPAAARSLCGRSLDWVEALRG